MKNKSKWRQRPITKLLRRHRAPFKTGNSSSKKAPCHLHPISIKLLRTVSYSEPHPLSSVTTTVLSLRARAISDSSTTRKKLSSSSTSRSGNNGTRLPMKNPKASNPIIFLSYRQSSRSSTPNSGRISKNPRTLKSLRSRKVQTAFTSLLSRDT